MTWGLDRATVNFGQTLAVSDLSLKIVPGEITVLVGGDGAGKTTTCRTLVGLERVASGEVRRPERTTFQPASSGVWADLTVLENLEFVAGAYGLGQTHTVARIDELLTVTGLHEAVDRLGSRLSGGMRQKLGVAMAVISEPDLLVLDEPTTGVDPVSRLELWSFIIRSAKEGRGVLVTTTYMDETARADSVVALDEGVLLATGTVDEIVTSMQGRLFEAKYRSGHNSWRRGGSWRVWSDDGSNPAGLDVIVPDITDVVTVAALSREEMS